MIYLETESQPEGSLETITGVQLELSKEAIEIIRRAAAFLLIHTEYDHLQLHIQTAFGQNKSRLVTDENTTAEWRYDTELIRVHGQTFTYRAQGKWDSNDFFESQAFIVENLNKQEKWTD